MCQAASCRSINNFLNLPAMYQHCCDRMKAEVDRKCDVHPRRADCPDALVDFAENLEEYGLLVHDGTSSIIRILYCPWCGSRLPESRRDEWHETLISAGIDPLGDDVPEEFYSSAWYKSKRTS